MNPPEENVLVVKRALFDELGAFQGLNFEPRKYLDAILSRGNNFFLRRDQAEKDPSHKQIDTHLQDSLVEVREGWGRSGQQVGSTPTTTNA